VDDADADDEASLNGAVVFLSELEEDRRTAPPEFLSLFEAYLPRLEESIRRFREGALPARELDAHVFQIRLSYARDLQKLLPYEPPPTARWTRTG
jgi:hypothetical protein